MRNKDQRPGGRRFCVAAAGKTTRSRGSATLRRYDEVARILTGNERATAEDGVAWLGELCTALKIAPLASYGVREEDFAVLAEKAAASNSMKGNPVTLTDAELREILVAAL